MIMSNLYLTASKRTVKTKLTLNSTSFNHPVNHIQITRKSISDALWEDNMRDIKMTLTLQFLCLCLNNLDLKALYF